MQNLNLELSDQRIRQLDWKSDQTLNANFQSLTVLGAMDTFQSVPKTSFDTQT